MAEFSSGDIAQLAYVVNTEAVTAFTAYTVPAGQKALILEIRSDNLSGTNHQITVSDGSAIRIGAGAANLLVFQGKIVLAAADIVRITKASGNEVRIVIMGIEVEA